jgi:hypothetical protein
MMTLDYALIRVSLFLSHFASLCWCEEMQLVHHVLAPFDWVSAGMQWLSALPIVGVVFAVLLFPVAIVATVAYLVAQAITLFVLGYAMDFAGAAGPVLAHAMAIGWAIYGVVGGK